MSDTNFEPIFPDLSKMDEIDYQTLERSLGLAKGELKLLSRIYDTRSEKDQKKLEQIIEAVRDRRPFPRLYDRCWRLDLAETEEAKKYRDGSDLKDRIRDLRHLSRAMAFGSIYGKRLDRLPLYAIPSFMKEETWNRTQ